MVYQKPGAGPTDDRVDVIHANCVERPPGNQAATVEAAKPAPERRRTRDSTE